MTSFVSVISNITLTEILKFQAELSTKNFSSPLFAYANVARGINIPFSQNWEKMSEGQMRVHSDYYKYCHSVLARVSRGWNAFAKVDKTILQNVELPFNANEQDDTESEVGKWTMRSLVRF